MILAVVAEVDGAHIACAVHVRGHGRVGVRRIMSVVCKSADLLLGGRLIIARGCGKIQRKDSVAVNRARYVYGEPGKVLIRAVRAGCKAVSAVIERDYIAGCNGHAVQARRFLGVFFKVFISCRGNRARSDRVQYLRCKLVEIFFVIAGSCKIINLANRRRRRHAVCRVGFFTAEQAVPDKSTAQQDREQRGQTNLP